MFPLVLLATLIPPAPLPADLAVAEGHYCIVHAAGDAAQAKEFADRIDAYLDELIVEWHAVIQPSVRKKAGIEKLLEPKPGARRLSRKTAQKLDFVVEAWFFATRADCDAVVPSVQGAGQYLGKPGQPSFYTWLEGKAEADVDQVLYHETFHHFDQRLLDPDRVWAKDGERPGFWTVEGAADFAALPRSGRSTLVLDTAYMSDRLGRFKIDLSRICEAGQRTLSSDAAWYNASSSLFRFLWESERYGAGFRRFLVAARGGDRKLAPKGVTGASELVKAVGAKDLAEIDAAFREWLTANKTVADDSIPVPKGG